MSSMVRDIDPVVRAALTAMFGIVVHFGTVWTMEDHIITYSFSSPSSSCISDNDNNITSNRHHTSNSITTFSPSLLLQILFLHEYWIYLQHMNVLANPLLQHLDRRYGIALLKSKKHWVIAGTLSAYWTRESLGMFLCLPYLMPTSSKSSSSASVSSSFMQDGNNRNNNFSMTQYLILYSLLYHTYKSRGVRKDASQYASSRLGIMTLVIDEFYVHNVYEIVLSAFRLVLQGSDTFIHYCIVRDLLATLYFSSSFTSSSSSSSTSILLHGDKHETWNGSGGDNGSGEPVASYYLAMVTRMHILFVIWVIHAALNQLFRCSTASLMVMWWQSLTKSRSGMKSTTDIAKADDGGYEQDERSLHEQYENRGVVDMEGECVPDRTRSVSSSNCSRVSTSSSGDDVDEDSDDYRAHRDRSGSCGPSGIGKDCYNVQIRREDFIVRQLLLPMITTGNKASRSMGNGTIMAGSSAAVDGAVQLSIAIAALSSFFMLGLRQVPLKALPLAIPTTSVRKLAALDNFRDENWLLVIVGLVQNRRRMLVFLAIHSWLLWSLLHAIWAIVIKSPQPPIPRRTNVMILKRTIIQLTDLSVMLSVASHSTSSNGDGINLRRNSILLICVLLTVKAYAQSMRYPKVLRRSLDIMELISKLAVLRALTNSTSFGATTDASSSILSITWVVWVMTQSSYNPTTQLVRDDCGHSDNDRVDVVFLGHPAFLSDSWALWLLPYSLKERWQAPFWAAPLWPIHYLVGWYVCNWGHYFLGDDCRYDQVRMQNWVAPHFGRHFVTHPRQVRENIEACARHAEKIEVRVLCLGALNKAESINGGGWGVGRALGSNRRLSIIHGNHLTAAAVVETVYRCFGDRKTKMFLTGASSKVGWAVARALRDRYGYDVLCHSTDPERRRHFEQNGFASASTLAEGSAYCRHWIVGKYDKEVSKAIPQGAVAIVFSVPHPLQGRRDVRVIEAGTLHMDLSRLEKPRLFANKLREHEIFACHAAAFVAAHRLDRLNLARIDEMGPVDPDEMDGWLADAQKLGFVVPHVEPVLESDANSLAEDDKPPVVIVGGGPSGLSVAAYLSQTQVPHIVLETEQNPDLFGSWGQHFSGLEITTNKKWCELPGLHMSEKDFPNEYVTAEEYQRYLKHYVHRFAINIQRGAKVTSIERGTDRSPYIVRYGEKDAVDAWAVVDASGKHRIPQKNTSDDIALKLISNGIPHVHSSELCDDAIWRQVIQAAQKGRLCIVGFGNSAADLINIILQQCHTNCNGDSPRIHIAARTVPPVFPRQINFLRVDSVGYLVRALPCFLQDMLVKGLWWALPDSRICNSAFPSHLQRWNQIGGRVPVIDKYGLLAMGFQSGSLVAHGPILDITKEKVVQFNDKPRTPSKNGSSSSSASLISSRVTIDMVILATGYKEDCVIEREDRLNGLYKCGFGNSDRFLPLRTVCEDAKYIADDISKSYTK